MRESRKKVSAPARGQGPCPKAKSRQRYKSEQCNVQTCAGNEICVAHQDLVIAVDGSGSMGEDGFDTLRSFAGKLVTRYTSMHNGTSTMKVGVVLFGNGHVRKDGSVNPPINVQPLTADLTAVQQRISSMRWQRGLTNMAQALAAAEKMLLLGARGHAQSAILVLSDGRYLFKYKTSEKAKDLRDKNIQIFMAPISEYRSKELDELRGWASQPWEANYERIPGIAALKNNEKMFAQKLLTKFCPLAVSPHPLPGQ